MTRRIWIPPAAIVAVLFALALPRLLEARNRSRQKQTMADMRSIATAWEARAADTHSYSAGPLTAAELARALEPKYIRRLPRLDAWGTEFQLTGTADSYAIRSLGSDSRFNRLANLSGPTTKFDDDIVLSDGAFVRYPESAG